MKAFLGLALIGLMVAAVVIFIPRGGEVVVLGPQSVASEVEIVVSSTVKDGQPSEPIKDQDIEPQKPLVNPPKSIKAIYITGWSASLPSRIANVKRLAEEGLINAVVLDVKDYSGYLSYETNIELAEKVGAHDEPRIFFPNKIIKDLHDSGIYLIARISVFQDPKLALGRPDLAIKQASSTKVWKDNKGLAWLDPAAQEVWDYVIEVGKDARARGFDELNYDYIRFPSDGDLQNISYPFWNESTPRHEIIRNFFSYLSRSLPEVPLSADLFGLVTVRYDDLGIGQVLEDAAPYFDAIAPMTYPSHYGAGFLGFANPAEHPYEIIDNALETSLYRIRKLQQNASSTNPPQVTIRPWLQDFDLGADYDEVKVRAQIEAVEKWQKQNPTLVDGWMLWSPSNIYTEKALYTIDKEDTLIDDSTSTTD